MEIAYPIPWLKRDGVLLDTPGIDSTDDAHQMATESALHLADAVFYVMDYNHVQSEINFAFTKKMKDRGKPLYLLVNQIDKHKESELSFESYKASVLEAFSNWNIKADGILFLSVKYPHTLHNEWGRLQELMYALIGRKKNP